MSGTLAGTDSWFGQSASQVSAHTGVGLHGARHQYVAFQNSAWANGILEPGNKWQAIGPPGNPNNWTLSIETEDLGDPTTPVSAEEYAATLQECRDMIEVYPHIKYLLGHSAISPLSRAHCPGDRWTLSGRFNQLAIELELKTL